jgi:hypothetical protein
MIHENDPNRSRGKRFSFTGCREGNLAVIRDDVPTDVARELDRLMAEEPPFHRAESHPRLASASLAALGSDHLIDDDLVGLLWVVPTALSCDVAVELVSSGTREASLVLDRFADAMPESLATRGFRERRDLWEPWCIALVDDQIASIAQTVRTGPGGAEVGVDTALELRGRGFAAATTARWSQHPGLVGSTLFYGTSQANASSRRVAERMGLRLIAVTFAVA